MINSPTTAIVASVVVLIYIIISFVNETFELCSVGLRYVLSWSNIFQLVQIGFAAIAIFPVLFSLDVTILHKNCAAVSQTNQAFLSMATNNNEYVFFLTFRPEFCWRTY